MQKIIVTSDPLGTFRPGGVDIGSSDVVPSLLSALASDGQVVVVSPGYRHGDETVDVDGHRLVQVGVAGDELRDYDATARLLERMRLGQVDPGARASWEHASYRSVNQRLRKAVLGLTAIEPDASVILVGHQLHGVARDLRLERPELPRVHVLPGPWGSPEAWRAVPRAFGDEIYANVLANDVVVFLADAHVRQFLSCCRELYGHEVDLKRNEVRLPNGHVAHVRSCPAPVDAEAVRARAEHDDVRVRERELLRATEERSLLLSVDQATPASNTLSVLRAYESFLRGNPEQHGRVTYVVQLFSSGEKAKAYIALVESAVERIDGQFGTPSWMPAELTIDPSPSEVLAACGQYDVLVVAGSSPIAQQGPLVNQRDGVLLLSDAAELFEQVSDHVVPVNPLSAADLELALLLALRVTPETRAEQMAALRQKLAAQTPAAWSTAIAVAIAAARGRA